MARPKEIETNVPSQLLDLLPDGTDRERHRRYFFEAPVKAIRSVLVSYLNKRITESVKKSDDPRNLDLPSYSEKQAYQSGYRQACEDCIKLLDR